MDSGGTKAIVRQSRRALRAIIDNPCVPQTPSPDANGAAARQLQNLIASDIRAAGGWLPFDRVMQQALYAPGLGYYASDSRQFGAWAEDGSDFVTAPELSPMFGSTLAVQVAQALRATGTDEIWEFGAGSGALAAQVLDELARLGQPLARYTIVDVSGALRARQQERLAAHGPRVRWADRLPEALRGVVLGNEVLDAMPVQLLARVDGLWHERGVTVNGAGQLAWQDRPTGLRPPVEIEGPHDYLTEIHPQAEAFIRTLGDRLVRGAAFFMDYGFGESEYYHPQRHMGTVMCHRAHQADDNPLLDVGLKDITAHVNFTGIVLAAQEQPLPPGQEWQLLGYTTQAHFLINAGLLPKMELQPLEGRAVAAKLIMEHEMGELFKVLALCKGEPWDALGFVQGDRTHRL